MRAIGRVCAVIFLFSTALQIVIHGRVLLFFIIDLGLNLVDLFLVYAQLTEIDGTVLNEIV